MKRKEKAKKEPLSYKEVHNKALDRFKKSSRLLIWVGALNVISLLVSIIQYASGESALFFYFCFGLNDLIFQALANIPGFFTNYTVLYFVTIVIIAILTTTGSTLLGVFASQGKKKFLYAYSLNMTTEIKLFASLSEKYRCPFAPLLKLEISPLIRRYFKFSS